MIKVFLRTSAGGTLGWGNLHRILILYDYFKKNSSFYPYLFIEGNKDVYNFLKKQKIAHIKINNLSLREEETKIKKFGIADISFLEVLNPKLSLQKIYKFNSKKFVILDDILKNEYISEIVFCCQKNNKFLKKNLNQKIYNDYKFFPVNKNFNSFLKKKKKINKEISKVVVFLGGGNYLNANLKIAKILKNMNLKVDFLIGSEGSNKAKMNFEKLDKNFRVFINSNKIPKKIFKSDLVICGGGYTKIETAYLKTPLICLCVQKHQNNLAQNFKAKFGVEIIKFKKNSYTGLKKLVMKQNYKNRKKINNKFSRYFSINGLERIIEKTIY